MLYPNRELSKFMERAVLNERLVSNSKLIRKLLEENNHSIIVQDESGKYHFNPMLKNANDLKSALQQLRNRGYPDLVDAEMNHILDAYEEVFHHHAFTGRSGTFFGYEGLGSIYWHMNSKLLLAVQEILYQNRNGNGKAKAFKDLKKIYDEIKDGLGMHKSPEVYGAFPTDPYSHTPANKGAQQPGMTGQVKEDILCRIGELGVNVTDNCLQFEGSLINQHELLKSPASFKLYNVSGNLQELSLDPGSLAFTFCQTPIVYMQSETSHTNVHYINGKQDQINGNKLSKDCTSKIFLRTGEIRSIEVSLPIGQD
jgi:hypothetical protein